MSEVIFFFFYSCISQSESNPWKIFDFCFWESFWLMELSDYQSLIPPTITATQKTHTQSVDQYDCLPSNRWLWDLHWWCVYTHGLVCDLKSSTGSDVLEFSDPQAHGQYGRFDSSICVLVFQRFKPGIKLWLLLPLLGMCLCVVLKCDKTNHWGVDIRYNLDSVWCIKKIMY